MLLTGVFAANVGLVHGGTHVFTVQVIALLIAAPYAFVGSWLLYKATDAIIPLRVSERQEAIGLDITQHDETVSSRGVRAAVEALQGELFARRDCPIPDPTTRSDNYPIPRSCHYPIARLSIPR